MKDTYYFTHDYHARDDDKILRLRMEMGAKGYGIFWMLAELLYESGGSVKKDFKALAFSLREDAKDIETVVSPRFELFENGDGTIKSKTVSSRLAWRNERRALCAEAGRASAEARVQRAVEHNSNVRSTPVQRPCNIIKDRKGKDRKEKKQTCPAKPDADSGFNEFYGLYPRHEAKRDAARAWTKLRPNAELITAILCAVKSQAESPAWLKNGGQYIPFPASWLNGRRWEDETKNMPEDDEEQKREQREHKERMDEIAAGTYQGG